MEGQEGQPACRGSGMTLPETIRASLARASEQGNRALLCEAYTGVVKALSGNRSTDRTDLELLVLCAEAALKVLDKHIFP